MLFGVGVLNEMSPGCNHEWLQLIAITVWLDDYKQGHSSRIRSHILFNVNRKPFCSLPASPCFPYSATVLVPQHQASLSHSSTRRLVIVLMDESVRRGAASLTARACGGSALSCTHAEPPIASRLWHIISPVICGQIEVEGDKDILCPCVNRWMLQCWRLSWWLFLFCYLHFLKSSLAFVWDWLHAS